MSVSYETTVKPGFQVQPQPDGLPAFLPAVAQTLRSKPFRPHRLFTSGDAQTLAAYQWPRRYFRFRAHRADEPIVFEVEPGVRLLAHCRWQENRTSSPTLLLAHGLEGSNTSTYMLGTAGKAHNAGFNVVRLNFRTCGETEHLAPTLYHSGLIGDLRSVISQLIRGHGLSRIFLAGFSLGGNMALLLAGEDAERLPPELAGLCAVSPTIDLQSCKDAIERRENWLYNQSFVRSMRERVRRKRKFFPERYDTKDLHLLRTIRDFDERFTIVEGGYSSVEEYYERASSLRVLSRIQTPTLMIHAQDDPFVPFEPFRDPVIAINPYLIFLAPEHGGHVGFLSPEANGEDRFWAENRVVEFCSILNEQLTS